MARIRNGILGGFSNKVGEVIGQNYAGISTMRAMPKYVTNPKTQAQEAWRAKMAVAGSFFSVFNRALSFTSFNKSSVNNAFNGAMRKNLKAFNQKQNYGIQPDLFSLYLGECVGAELNDFSFDSCELDTDKGALTCEFSWGGKSDSDFASDNDSIVVMLAYLSGNNECVALYGDVLPVERHAEACTLTFNVGEDVVAGGNCYVAVGVVAESCIIAGHNPNKPKEIIKIPAKGLVKKSAGTIRIPAHNIPAFRPKKSFVSEVIANHQS